MYLGIYPGLKKSKPDKEHLLIAKRFQDDVIERCFIAPDSMFDSNNFVYKKANTNNCFKKSANDKKYHSLSGKHNQFYSQLGDLDSGDAILQVGYFNHFWFLLGMIAYTYRIVFRNPLLRLKDRRKSYV